jgi:hypothetical protein
VDRLRGVRAALRAVEAPDPARREQALAAALAAFGEDDTEVRAAPPAPVPRPSRARPRWGGLLAAAAAAVLVVGAGVAVVSTSNDGGDDDSAAVAPGDADDEQSDAAPQMAREEDEAPGAPAPAATESATESAGDVSGEGDGGVTDDTVLAQPTVALTTPEELAEFARLRQASGTGEGGDTGTCPVPGSYVGAATYGGTPVEVVVDDGVATALDVATCQVVERVEL